MDVKPETERVSAGSTSAATFDQQPSAEPHSKSRSSNDPDNKRRRCVSTACIACRRRKSKCDGNLPSCAACTSVYQTQCVYDPSSDHRRKGVYKKDLNGLKAKSSTLQTLVQAILHYPEDDVPDLVRSIRACESLDRVAESIASQQDGRSQVEEDEEEQAISPDSSNGDYHKSFESQLSSKVGELRLDNGKNSLFLEESMGSTRIAIQGGNRSAQDATTSWTKVTSDSHLIRHLLNYYFCYHFAFFTILPRTAFERDFDNGILATSKSRNTQYCSPILVNAMLALGCHFTSCPGARSHPEDSATAGDHFFTEAKRLIYEEDLLATPRLTTVQALALMSVREAGCGREARGWVYSGMAFRMACDLGLSFASSPSSTNDMLRAFDDEEEDAKRITFWGCFMIDKCWSNYLGRLPIFERSTNVTVPKFEVFPMDDAADWCSYTESGFTQTNAQPSRVRAVALQVSALCDISSDLISRFYHPSVFEKPLGKQIEVKRLKEIHSRLEDWKRQLPKSLEPKEGILPSVIVMHMLFQVLYIHLFRPFLKYNQATSPLPNNISPRKLCTQAASHISKLLRLYKRSHGLRCIVNLAVYITHSACTIHLLNIPEKNARRDICHGVKALEEIAEGWLCARRTLMVLSAQARMWQIELPEEAAQVLARTDNKFGSLGTPTTVSTGQGHIPLPSLQLGSNRQEQSTTAFRKQRDTSQHPVYHEAQGTIDSSAVVRNTKLFNEGALAGELPDYVNRPSVPSPTQRMLYGMVADTSDVPHRQNEHSLLQLPEQQKIDTQQTPTTSQPSRKRRLPPAAHASSMFGGVEALLREGQDWWMKDQSQMALGFDNWSYVANEGWDQGQQSRRQRQVGRRPSIAGAVQHMHHTQQPQQMLSHMEYPSSTMNRTAINATAAAPTQASRDDGMTNDSATSTSNTYAQDDLGSGCGLFSSTYNESEWYQ